MLRGGAIHFGADALALCGVGGDGGVSGGSGAPRLRVALRSGGAAAEEAPPSSWAACGDAGAAAAAAVVGGRGDDDDDDDADESFWPSERRGGEAAFTASSTSPPMAAAWRLRNVAFDVLIVADGARSAARAWLGVGWLPQRRVTAPPPPILGAAPRRNAAAAKGTTTFDVARPLEQVTMIAKFAPDPSAAAVDEHGCPAVRLDARTGAPLSPFAPREYGVPGRAARGGGSGGGGGVAAAFKRFFWGYCEVRPRPRSRWRGGSARRLRTAPRSHRRERDRWRSGNRMRRFPNRSEEPPPRTRSMA